jgi:hypothetical protein
VVTQSPDVVIGMRLLDVAKRHGFTFRRIAPGPDGPLWGIRDTEHWHDTLYLSGFWAPDSCSATRRRKSSLLVPGDLLVTDRVSGDALNVLNTVVSYWPP